MNPALLRDHEGTSPEALYGAYRYLDRLFAEKREHRQEEISGLEVDALTPRVRYLMRHLLILQGRYETTLNTYPNLRALESTVTPELPIILSRNPLHSWSYLRKMGIWL